MLLVMGWIVSALCVGSGCLMDESEALVRFRASLYDREGYLSSWLNGTDCCKWRGVECHGETGHVSKVDIHGFNLSTLRGRIDSSLFALQHLTHLDLSSNAFYGSQLPHQLGRLRQLKYLNMSNAGFRGTVPPQLGNLSGLRYLDLSFSYLHSLYGYDFDILKLSSHSLDWLTRLSSLYYLSLGGMNLSVAGKSWMGGAITGIHLQNLTKLVALRLSNSGLRLMNISSTWIPPFQLRWLSLCSCKIGGPIPKWISTQKSLQTLLLADNNLVGDIPSWLWDLPSIKLLGLGQNYLQQVSFPSSLGNIQILDLSNNQLRGKLHLSSLVNCSMLTWLSVENNRMDGNIPESLANCSNLQVLRMANNRLEGRIPEELGNLQKLHFLHIQKNKLGGSLPRSLGNCTELQALDLGNNAFAGNIPAWIGDLSKLQVLVLRSNYFRGKIPSEFSQMDNLHVLDISSNCISGTIPESILSLPAMTKIQEKGSELGNQYYNFDADFSVIYRNGLELHNKGKDMHYPYVLSTLNCIDLANNQLTG
eukprot:Gb_22859 [translate_table: standard]